ncbi:MAG: response regulator transcription factor [Betaproteobacteria bacterium]|nr:response regulator transcription factor [Betaproteobacteria bacterium]
MNEPVPSLAAYVVDDDAAIRDSLVLLLSLRGHRAAAFASAEDFLAAAKPDWAGCAIVDIRMPGMDGLALLRRLNADGVRLPVVIVTGHGDVASAREAFRNQAVDFLEKPFDAQQLVSTVEAVFQRERERLVTSREAGQRQRRLEALSAREREVLEQLLLGLHNRDVGARLGISPRTVEVHKARILDKLGARNIVDLLRQLNRG